MSILAWASFSATSPRALGLLSNSTAIASSSLNRIFAAFKASLALSGLCCLVARVPEGSYSCRPHTFRLKTTLDKHWEEALHVLLAALLRPSLSLFLVGEFQSSLSREDQGVSLQGDRHVEAVEGVSVNLLDC